MRRRGGLNVTLSLSLSLVCLYEIVIADKEKVRLNSAQSAAAPPLCPGKNQSPSERGWGFSYNGLSYNGLSYNNLTIFKQDSAITGLSYNKKGKSYNGKSYNGQESAITESAITEPAITDTAIT